VIIIEICIIEENREEICQEKKLEKKFHLDKD